MTCPECLGQKGHGNIVDGWTECERCNGTGTVSPRIQDDAAVLGDRTVGLSLVFHAATRLIAQCGPAATSMANPVVVPARELEDLRRACHAFADWSIHLTPIVGWQEVIKDAFLEGRHDDACEILMMEGIVIKREDPRIYVEVCPIEDGRRLLKFSIIEGIDGQYGRVPLAQQKLAEQKKQEYVFCDYCSTRHPPPECSRFDP